MVTQTSSYSNRTVDIMMVTPPPDPSGEVELRFPSPSKVGTGVQKLIQRFLIILLTAPDTVFLRDDQGTLLGEMVRTGMIMDQSLIRNTINLSIRTTLNLIEDEQPEDTLDDEYLVDAFLESFEVVNSSEIRCTIGMETRDSSIYVIPISIGSI